jgi:hypothetical protein
MRVGPSEPACRSRFQTTFRRLWTKAMVVSTEGKGLAKTRSGNRQEEDRKGTTMEVSKGSEDDVKTVGASLPRDQAPTKPVYGRSGIRHERWPELAKRRLSGTWEPETSMQTEKPRVAEPQGREYGSGVSGAEQRAVAEKSPTKGWSQGAVSRSLIQ